MNTFKMWILGLVASIIMMPAAFAGTLDTVKSQGFFIILDYSQILSHLMHMHRIIQVKPFYILIHLHE